MAKNRFTVSVEGRERQLFAFQDLPDGTAMFFPNVGDGHDHPDGEVRISKQTKISVHPSPDAPGCLIKHQRIGSDRSLVETTAFVHADPGKLIWPLYGRKVQDLSLDKYILPESKLGGALSVSSFDPLFTTMFYSIIVTDAPLDLARVPHSDLSRGVIGCGNFFFYPFIGYWALPSMASGTNFFPATSAVRLDTEPPDVESRREVQSLEPEEIPKFLEHIHRELAKGAVGHIVRDLGEEARAKATFRVSAPYAEAAEAMAVKCPRCGIETETDIIGTRGAADRFPTIEGELRCLECGERFSFTQADLLFRGDVRRGLEIYT